MSLALDRLNFQPTYLPSELENRFRKLRFIGSGGEGNIYEVQERLTGLIMALKIANNNWSISSDNREVAKSVSLILDHGISPHLTRIHELLTVKCAVFALPANNIGDGFF